MNHFDYLFGYFTNNSCDIYSIYQMIHRVRKLNKNKIYLMFDILQTNDIIPNNINDIKESIKYSFKQLYNESLEYKIKYINNESVNIIDEENIFYKLWLDNRYIKNKSHYYVLYEFLDILKKNKCNYEFIFKNNNNNNVINVDSIIKDLTDDDNLKILKSPDITLDTYELMCNNVLLTEEEKFIKKRFFIRQLYNYYNDLTIEFLNKYNNSLTIQQCINLIRVKNFTVNINNIINNLQQDYSINTTLNNIKVDLKTCEINQSKSTNEMFSFLLIEKILILKKIIDIIYLSGLNIYNNKNILYSDFLLNIENNNNEILNIFNISYNNNNNLKKISYKEINKLLQITWNIELKIEKLNSGGCEYINLIKSKLFKNSFPISCNW